MKKNQKVFLALGGGAALLGIVLVPTTVFVIRQNSSSKESAPLADNSLAKLETYVKTINPKIKSEKVSEKSKTLATSINSEIKLKTWFTGLPVSHGDIEVKFVSSIASTSDPSILEMNYVFKTNSQTYNYKFIEKGFYQKSQDKQEDKVEKPIVKPQEPVAKPEDTTVKPQEPVTKPEEKPQVPTTKPEEKPLVKPVTKPEVDERSEEILGELNVFISNLRPIIRPSKQEEAINTYAQMISNETDVREWFQGLPYSKNGIKVEFVSVATKSSDSSTIEVKYKISKENQSLMYSFSQSGFKVGKPNYKIYQSENGLKFTNEGEILGLSGTYVKSLVIPSKLRDIKTQLEVPIRSIRKKAFQYKSIESLTIGSLINKIGDFAFNHSNIKKLTFQGRSQLRHIGEGAFAEHSIEHISIPQNVEFIGVRAFQTLQHIIKRPLQTINFNGNDNLTKISEKAFAGNWFKEIDLPINLETIDYNAFDIYASEMDIAKNYELTVYYHNKEIKNNKFIFYGYNRVTLLKK